MTVVFPVSGVEVAVWIPFAVAFLFAFISSMGGLSGAFLVLPFQMSVLGYTAPGVSATNLVYNIVATPGAILGYLRERRMLWPLTALLLVGLMPGQILGAWIRLKFLPEPGLFRLFVGVVLLLLGVNVFRKVIVAEQAGRAIEGGVTMVGRLENGRLICVYEGRRYSVNALIILVTALLVGAVSGVYGLGGSALMAPFLVGVMGLPVYVIAGSTLTANFGASLVGIIAYTLLAGRFEGVNASPDWLLGVLFGVGGLLGMYTGARCQRFVPSRLIRLIVAVSVLFVAIKYLLKFFTS
jgi:hypothetical protein